jgi:hypothetical protein
MTKRRTSLFWENISQTASFVVPGSADVGIVALSLALKRAVTTCVHPKDTLVPIDKLLARSVRQMTDVGPSR